MKKTLAIASSLVLTLSLAMNLALVGTAQGAVKINKAGAKTTGSYGQYITVSSTKITNGAQVKIVGKGFDETVGIYLGFCVLPKKSQAPSPCGGGINKEGASASSLWISSNPPPYGSGAAIPYLPGGRFTSLMRISKMIGKIDCSKTPCAITVRADHLRSQDRSHDLFIPIQFR